MRTPAERRNPNPVRNGLGRSAKPRPRPPIERVVFIEREISVWGWPSRGGLIVFERAGPLDFDHLGLNRLQPAASRASDQNEEDAFCQKLLQLGARWFDGRERYGFFANLCDDGEPEHEAVMSGEEPAPSDVERRWVSVGLEEGGFWVLEYDRNIFHLREKRNVCPSDASRVMLAETMQERCEILKDMGAKFYRQASEYTGLACINAWATKESGEHGPLTKT
jgi:hypothetical protein